MGHAVRHLGISSVKFNGEPLPYFKPLIGLCQGYPLSPNLFIVVANVLSFLMQKKILALKVSN